MKKYIVAMKKLITGDYMTRFELMTRIARFVFPEYRFKWPQLDWWHDDEFTHYLERFSEENGMNTDRRWMLKQLLRLTSHIPGDTAECGVYMGASSYLICESNSMQTEYNKKHIIFDSFEGLSEPGVNDDFHWSKGDLSAPEGLVRKALIDFPDIEILRGWIPSRFGEVGDRVFSFVHIDVDLYEPTRESIRFFYPKVSAGGIILCDDYGCTTCPGATKAIDDFLEDKPEKMLSLCSGGGFLIKGCYTSV